MPTSASFRNLRRGPAVRHSQGLAPADRLQRRADELYARAGWESEEGTLIHKHKWMRWRTFNQLMARANALSTAADQAFLYRLGRLGFFSEDDAMGFVLGEQSEPLESA